MSLFKKVFRIIKQFISREELKRKNIQIENQINDSNYNKLYSKIDTGSIIWAKRYKDEQSLENIPVGHEEGPFLVFKKEDGKIYCFYGTGNYIDVDFSIALNNLEYDFLVKETYFNLYKLKIVDEFSLINVLGCLNETDKNNFYGKIKCYKRKDYTINGKVISIDIPRQCGDVVKFNNKKYIVLDIKDNKLICIPMRYTNETASNLNYSKVLTLDDTDKVIGIGALSNKQLMYALNNYKEYIKNKENINKTQRGSVIYKDNKYYYIYGEEGQNFLGFEMFNLYANNCDILNLNNTIYYTFYNEIYISKKEEYKNIYLCLDKEKELTKLKRKTYKSKMTKQEKENNIEEPLTKITRGSVIKLDESSNEEFYVKDIIGSILVCIPEAEKNNHNPKKNYFNKSDVILVKNIDKKR